jgi:hypothetical protein
MNRRAAFKQSDVTKVFKAYRDAGLPTPQLVIEPQRITVSPVTNAQPNPWDAS